MAVENLQALNRAREDGLWNGRVQVLEFGPKMLQDNTRFTDWPVIAGAIVDFEVGVHADIFVDTNRGIEFSP